MHFSCTHTSAQEKIYCEIDCIPVYVISTHKKMKLRRNRVSYLFCLMICQRNGKKINRIFLLSSRYVIDIHRSEPYSACNIDAQSQCFNECKEERRNCLWLGINYTTMCREAKPEWMNIFSSFTRAATILDFIRSKMVETRTNEENIHKTKHSIGFHVVVAAFLHWTEHRYDRPNRRSIPNVRHKWARASHRSPFVSLVRLRSNSRKWKKRITYGT